MPRCKRNHSRSRIRVCDRFEFRQRVRSHVAPTVIDQKVQLRRPPESLLRRHFFASRVYKALALARGTAEPHISAEQDRRS
jgi:hypothetical protein